MENVKETKEEKRAKKEARKQEREQRRQEKEQKKLAKLAAKQKKSQVVNRESDNEDADSVHRRRDSPSSAPYESSPTQQQPRRRKQIVAMDPNAIDPNLRDAEGTVQNQINGQHAPTASMQNRLSPDMEYSNMLPLIQAAEQAQRIARSSAMQPNEYYAQAEQEPTSPAVPSQQHSSQYNLSQQSPEKPVKKRGRPKKVRNDTVEAVAPATGGQREGSVDSVLGPTIRDAPTDTMTNGADLGTSKKTKKRRRKADAVEGEAGAEEADADGQPSKKIRKLPPVVDETGLTEKDNRKPSAGPLTKLEWRLLDATMEQFKMHHGMDQHSVNELVQNTTRAQSPIVKDLWKEMYGTLEHRQHVAVMRACRRRYNNYEARGKWTDEEDDMLRKAYADSPGKWVKIGGVLGRMPEDCRDRWRNYLSCGDQRRIDDWTTREELDLRKYVSDLAEALKQDAKNKAKEEGHAFRERDWESEVNFNNISEKMGFTRSRLQCYTHWKVMNNRDPSIHGSVRTSEGASNRQGRALANFKKMLPGDKYQILQFIQSSPARDFEEVPWKQIARENPTNRWTTRDRKEAFHKMRADHAMGNTDFRSAVDLMLQYFTAVFPNDLETLTPPLDPTQKTAAQNGGEDGEEDENQPSSDIPWYAGPETTANGGGAVEMANQADDSGQGQGQAAVAQMASAKPKKPRAKKGSKKSKETISAEDEQDASSANPTRSPEAAAGNGTSLAQHLMNANAIMPNPYEPRDAYEPIEVDAPQEADPGEKIMKRKRGAKPGGKKKAAEVQA